MVIHRMSLWIKRTNKVLSDITFVSTLWHKKCSSNRWPLLIPRFVGIYYRLHWILFKILFDLPLVAKVVALRGPSLHLVAKVVALRGASLPLVAKVVALRGASLPLVAKVVALRGAFLPLSPALIIVFILEFNLMFEWVNNNFSIHDFLKFDLRIYEWMGE